MTQRDFLRLQASQGLSLRALTLETPGAEVGFPWGKFSLPDMRRFACDRAAAMGTGLSVVGRGGIAGWIATAMVI